MTRRGAWVLNHHLINDERCAVFAADAYAKASNRVGLVDATLGPGATNLVTGLVEALNAGSPMVAIIGDAHRDHAGKNMTQETDQVAILRPACKELLRLEAVHRIPEIMRRAFALATSGTSRPGGGQCARGCRPRQPPVRRHRVRGRSRTQGHAGSALPPGCRGGSQGSHPAHKSAAAL